MVNIQFQNEISEDIEDFSEKQHAIFEKQNNIECNYTPFAFTATEDSKMIGVVSGYTCYSEIYIDDIVVIPNARSKGVGRKLLTAVENHYQGASFNNMNLVTNEFQAPKFYEKCGFTLEFTRINKDNARLNKYFYVKFFNTHPL